MRVITLKYEFNSNNRDLSYHKEKFGLNPIHMIFFIDKILVLIIKPCWI